MRLFIAINFNKQETKTLKDYLEKIKDASEFGSFSKPENLHLTLTFIGETNDVIAAKKAVDQLSANEFTLKFSGVGLFSKADGDVYYTAVEDNENLTALVNQLTSSLNQQGFKIKNRKYTPHITLGRRVKLNKKIADMVCERSVLVNKISLMKSETINGELKYTEVYNKMLNSI